MFQAPLTIAPLSATPALVLREMLRQLDSALHRGDVAAEALFAPITFGDLACVTFGPDPCACFGPLEASVGIMSSGAYVVFHCSLVCPSSAGEVVADGGHDRSKRLHGTLIEFALNSCPYGVMV
jgi:hypothetical protein